MSPKSDMSDRLPPIPTPRSQIWRQIRLQYIPVIVFFIGLAAAAFIWSRWVAPPTLVGEAEAIRAELRSAQSGRIVELKVDLLQPVKAGDVIGHVLLNEPGVIASSLAVIRAEMEVLRRTSNLTIEQLELDWMNKRVQLVALQGQLQQAEANLARSTQLHRGKLITDEEYEQARNTRDAVQAQLKAQTELNARIDPTRPPSANQPDTRAVTMASNELSAAIAQKEEQLRLIEAQLGPAPLIAPIDGVVTLVYRRAGEAISAAEPILQVTALRSERIVGFIRQPVTLDAKPGMAVEVRTRSMQRQSAMTTVTQVGQQLEPVTPSLLAAMRLPVTTIPSDFGLRIHIAPPPGLLLRPGETVDVIIHD
ncbi:MAG: hypothetical protein V4773_27775 [Verrucomicrobiota bacterium]